MGLDTYAVVGCDTLYEAVEPNKSGYMKPKERLFKNVKGLCGGMLSGNGQGSFRGKVYSGLVEEITGESLYQNDITPETCKDMSDKLVEYAENMKNNIVEGEYGETTRDEIDALAEFFHVCAENGFHVHGWW